MVRTDRPPGADRKLPPPGRAARIIIFGAAVRADGQPSATLRRRVEAAFAAGGRQARYLPTGAVGRHGASEASVMAGLLRGWGVPAAQITLEETGTDTLSSAVACAALVRPGDDVRACSSAYHLPRCLLLLRMAGVAARPVWAARRRIEPYWLARECAALPWDAYLMWRRRRRHMGQ